MSLRTFHAVFIACAVVLTLLFALWSGAVYAAGGGAAWLATALLAIAAGGGLTVYDVAFLRRCRQRGLW